MVNGAAQLGQVVKVFEIEDLDDSFFAVHGEADGKSIPYLETVGYLIYREPQLERQRLEQACFPEEPQLAEAVFRAVTQSIIVGEPSHLGVICQHDFQHAAVDQMPSM